MSARKLAAAALMTAALAGPASAQMPPAPLPLGGGAGAGPPPMGPIAPGYPPGPEYAPPGMGYPAGGYAAGGGCPPGALDDIGQIRGPRAWVGAEYVVYWTKNAPTGVIATGGPAAGFGILGASGTQTVMGDEGINFREQHGVRINGGYWLTEAIALEGSVFVLPSKDQSVGPAVPTALLPTLARPFYDANLKTQNVRLLARPNTFDGKIQTDATIGLWGAEIAGTLRAIERGPWTLDGILGFKHISLEESLTITDSSTALALGVANFNGVGYKTGATTVVQDYFSTSNRIYAAMIGSRLNLHMDAFTLSLTSKVSLGVNEQSVSADGSTQLIGPFPAVSKVGGGLLAVGPNVGKFTRSEFAYVPEINLNLTAQLTPHLTLSFGYNFLYIGSVVRPGDQLTSPVNPVYVPTSSSFGGKFGPVSPTTDFNTSSFWAHGLNLGLTLGF